MATSVKADADFNLWLALRTADDDERSDNGAKLQALEDAILDRAIVDDMTAIQVGTVILACLEDGEINGDQAIDAMSRLLQYLGGRPDMIYADELTREVRRACAVSAPTR